MATHVREPDAPDVIDEYPATPTQEGMLFHTLREPGKGLYFERSELCFEGALDLACFAQAWQQATDQHPALRTYFAYAQDDRLVQRVLRAHTMAFTTLDWRTLPDEDKQQRLAAFLDQDLARELDPMRAPPLRVAAMRMTDALTQVVVTYHHAILDGWSFALVWDEVFRRYDALVQDRPVAVTAPRPYRDYIDWLATRDDEQAAAFWSQTFAGYEGGAPFRLDGEPAAGAQVIRRRCQLGADDTAALQRFARASRVTFNTVLQGAWALVLRRYTGRDDVVHGITTSGRPALLEGADRMVGLFINTLPLRLQARPDEPLTAWLRSVQRRHADVLRHDHCALAQVQRWCALPHDGALFDSILVFESFPNRDPLRDLGQPLRMHQVSSFDRTNFPLTLIVKPGAALTLELIADPACFGGQAIERVLGYLTYLLVRLPAYADRPLDHLPGIHPDEAHLVTRTWNDTARAYPGPLIHQRFEQQAAAHPDRVALVCGQESLTYGQTNRRANQLAALLHARGVGPDTLVGICLERSLDMALAILAILKAGGAYVPMDPTYPAERVRFLIEDARVPVLLTHRRFLDRVGVAGDHTRVLCLDAMAAELDAMPESNPEIPLTGEHLAYMIYTSGSTGQPKGAANRHGAILGRILWMQETYGLDAGDRVLQKTPFGFDVSVWELLWPLATGARLVFARPEGHKDSGYLAEIIDQQAITTIHFVPSMLAVFLDEVEPGRCASLRRVICSGEALSRGLQDRCLEHLGSAALHNLYGPTEAAIDVTSWACERDRAGALVPIGRPIANCAIYILDAAMRPVPVGATGELYIGGANLARGYHRRPALTAERFVPDPFAARPGARMYRTGDLARFTGDGVIEFLGRSDHQVKIRGFRIELGEIEAAITDHPGVSEAVVVAHRRTADDVRLVGYYVGQADQSAALRDHLERRLPGYMIPMLVPMEHMPLTPNGKIDRKALPAPVRGDKRPQAGSAPAGALEKSVAAIWADVLGLDAPDLDSNFFDLGGHSLLLARVHRKLRKALQVDVPLNDLFQYPTIRTLARFLERVRGGSAESAESAMPGAALARRRAAARSTAASDIAIIGMAGRFPRSPDLHAFWDNLQNGVECITFFAPEELAAAGHDPATLADPQHVPANGFMQDVDMFDAGFFGYTPREAEIMDPQHRLLLECAWQALEDAGHAPGSEAPLPAGVWAGSSISTYLLFHLFDCRGRGRGQRSLPGGFRTMLHNDKDYLATRIAYKLDLRGPAMTVQTACSTSLVAVHQACQSLLMGECAMALAGGVSIILPQVTGYRHVEGDILSPDGHCRPFDHRSGGTCSGEGVGMVVLKPLADALRDGDHIRAVIKGTAINNDGMDKIGYTAPSQAGQAEVIHAAQAQAGVHPDSITYIEAHGTGTALGDPIEIAALTQAFRARTTRTGYCAIGALKSNIGHADAAAGVAGLIKTVLMLEHRALVPTLHFEAPNPALDLDRSPFYVNTERRPWPAQGAPRRAGVSSFGMGGTNAHAVLEEAPARQPGDPGRPYQLLTLSARSAAALERMTDDLAVHLRRHPDLDLADVCATRQRGRKPFAHRRFLVLGPDANAGDLLAERAPGRLVTGVARSGTQSVAFLFPGQGTQHVAMGQGLYQREPVFRDAVDQCARVLEPHLGLDLRDLLYPATGEAEPAAAMLRRTDHAQPALFTIQYAAAQTWMAWGIRPRAMLGHSIGEYTAACLAGVLAIEDALALVAARGRLMASVAPGAMLAVFQLPADEVTRMLDPELSLAAVNGDRLCVVSGPLAAIDRFADRLARADIPHRVLVTSHAFHSAMMDPILGAFADRVRRVRLHPPAIPYLSNLTGDWITAAQATDPDYWARHLRGTVRFADGVTRLLADDTLVLLETGAGTSLRSMIARQPDGKDRVVSTMRAPTEDRDDQAMLMEAAGQLWMRGAAIDWDGLYHGQRRCRVPLPAYPFERRSYWVAADDRAANANAGAGADADADADRDSDAGPAAAGAVRPETSHPRPALAMAYAAPRDEVETLLCQIWAAAFGFDAIGIHDNYFDLGGDSILALQLGTMAASHGITMTPVDIAEHQTVAALASLPALRVQARARAPHAPAQHPAPLQLTRVDQATLARLRAAWPDMEDLHPLSPMQQTMLAHLHQDPGLRVYLGCLTVELGGALDAAALERTWQMVVDRHPVLRSLFVRADDPAECRQLVLGRRRLSWTSEDWRTMDAAARGAALERVQEANLARVADPTAGPPLALTLIRMADDDHRLLLAYHHLLLDDRALSLVWREAFALYHGLRSGTAPDIDDVPPFRHFIGWLAGEQGDDALARAREYWHDLLAGMPAPATMGGAAAHPGGTRSSPVERILLEPAASDRIRGTAREHAIPLGVVMQGLWACLIGRHTGRHEVVHGMRIAGRPADLAGATAMPGVLANLVPCRLQLDPEQSLLAWLRALQQYNRVLHHHEQHPLHRICGWAGVPAARAFFFESILALEDIGVAEPFRALDLRLAGWSLFRRTPVPLSVSLASIDGRLSIHITYQDEVFSPGAIRRILHDYRALLDTFARDPHRMVRDLLQPASDGLDPRA